MKKIIINSIIRAIIFVTIFTFFGYFFNDAKTGFFEYLKSQAYKNLFFLALMFAVFFLDNYMLSKGKTITWKSLFSRKTK